MTQTIFLALAAVLLAVGLAAALALRLLRPVAERLADRVARLVQRDQRAAQAAAVQTVVSVAGERMGAEGRVIDRQLAEVKDEMARMSALVRELERDRESKFGDLAGQLRFAGEQTAALADTTSRLREALSGTKARGQWGERMADDVLRLAGFVENVNYRRQRAGEGGGIPDFTFLLPAGQVCHMDVKFPLDNYLRSLDADVDMERLRFRRAFLSDVRGRVRELAKRDYAADERSVDVVLLFIPNEQLYCYIQEHDAALLDEALRSKVVMCSPLTLFAVLAVIRQAADSFTLQQRSQEILGLMGGFTRQWGRFVEQMDKLGRRLEGAQRDYDSLMGARRRQLDRQLERIDDLRTRDGPGGGEAVATGPDSLPWEEAAEA